MAGGIWRGVHPKVIGRSEQLSQNKFFDLRTPFSPISYSVTDRQIHCRLLSIDKIKVIIYHPGRQYPLRDAVKKNIVTLALETHPSQ